VPNAAKAELGEIVMLVPQAHAYLANEHDERNVIGIRATAPDAPDTETPDHIPHWTLVTSTLLRKGFGVLVVREGQLQVGPSDWDSGD